MQNIDINKKITIITNLDILKNISNLKLDLNRHFLVKKKNIKIVHINKTGIIYLLIKYFLIIRK
jgi:hypothetical protein